MQFKQIFTVVALAATTLAFPTVELGKRTDPISQSTYCNAAGGTLSCCSPKQNESSGSLSTQVQNALGGLLGLAPSVIPQILPKVAVAVQCFAVAASIVACGNAAICCAGGSNSAQADPTGIINLILLSNDNIAVCPGITA